MKRRRLSRTGKRYFMAMILFWTALLPIQQTFACEIMGGTAKAACCCQDQMTESDCNFGGCGHGEQAPLGENGCCQVSLSEPAIYTSQSSVNHMIGVAGQIEPPQSPPFIVLSSSSLPTTLFHSPSPVVDVPHQLTGHKTYLLTHRLRI